MKIKICGITNTEDALLCESCGADALGFVFYEKSRRYITPYAAKQIVTELSGSALKVGVFVNHTADFISDAVSILGLDLIQLHGDESPEFAEKMPRRVIKSFCIRDGFNFHDIHRYRNILPLLDTYSEDSFGGSGKKFRWEMIPAEFRSKIILAGGIGSDDLKYISENIHPFAVDISSSLEKYPGRKAPDKIRHLFDTYKLLKLKESI